MTVPQVTVVIVAYQSARVIRRSLAALESAARAGTARVVVVDNGSRDETVAVVAQNFPWAEILAGHGNIGYGKGCNLGLRVASTPYVLFLNPDVALGSEALGRLLAAIDSCSELAVVAPAILERGLPQAIGVRHSPWASLLGSLRLRSVRSGGIALKPGDEAVRTDWVCGAVMLCRTGVVRDLGGFDPRFFLYFEETDLCRRILLAGHAICATGKAVAEHAAGESSRETRSNLVSGCIAEHFFQSRFYFWRKHWGLAPAALAELADFAGSLVRLTGATMFGRRTAELRNRAFRIPFRSPNGTVGT